MVENKTIGINTLITLLIVTAGAIVPGFFDEPQYYCESRPEIGLVTCDSFSKYVDPNGKCVVDDGPNYICRTGWSLVTNDLELGIDSPVQEVIGKQYVCSPESCKQIN